MKKMPKSKKIQKHFTYEIQCKNLPPSIPKDSKLASLLTNSKYEQIFHQVTNERIIDKKINDYLKNSSMYHPNHEIYTEVSKKVKNVIKDKLFSITFLNFMISSLLEREFSPVEILNEVYLTISLIKSLRLYESKTMKDLINRNPSKNEMFFTDERLKYFLFQYKTFDQEEFNTMDYSTMLIKSEGKDQLRRPLGIEYDHYNYLPIQCDGYCDRYYEEFVVKLRRNHPDLDLNQNELLQFKALFYSNCIFAHNSNEIMFHPLKYKTKLCSNTECQRGKECFDGHKDELLHNFNTSTHEEILQSLDEFLKQRYSRKLNKLLEEFGQQLTQEQLKIVKEIKTLPCSKMALCDNINKCLGYHSNYERRRINFFPQNNKPCAKVFKNGRWLNPNMCSLGDNCSYFHTNNELMWDLRNYQKVYSCYQEIEVGECINYRQCPYKHTYDISVDQMYLPESAKEELKGILDNYFVIREETEKLHNAIESLRCIVCLEYIKGRIIFFNCGHIMCTSCNERNKNCMFNCDNKKEPYVLTLPEDGDDDGFCFDVTEDSVINDNSHCDPDSHDDMVNISLREYSFVNFNDI